MMHEKQKHHMDGLLALLLFGLFSVCILAVLLTGGQTYRRLAARDEAAYAARTAAQYVSTRVRQADVQNAVSVGDFCGCTALTLTEEIDGAAYVTRVYWYEGWLRELFSSADAEMTPADGEKVLEIGEMTMDEVDGLLTVVLDGETVLLRLRAGGAA